MYLFEAASLGDIYTKYYSDIPEDVFNQIVSSDPTYREGKMGKYGKWLLSLYKSNFKSSIKKSLSKYLLLILIFP